MDKNLEYTIAKGRLHCTDETTEISFALIAEDDGLYRVEAFLIDENFFKWGEAEEIPVFWMTGTTEKGYDLEITDLFLSRYTPHHSKKIEFISHGHVKLTKQEEPEPDPPPHTETGRPRIWYVELEGLRIKHADHTRLHQARHTPHRNHFQAPRFDHTACAMMLNQFPDNGNAFSFSIIGGLAESPALLDFTHTTNSTLYWDNYVQVRNNLVHFLSLLNGGKMAIRREYTGDSYRPSESQMWSQVMYVHSFRRRVNPAASDFLPINDHHSHTRRVFQRAMFNCFDEYCKLEEEFDLNNVVDALHESIAASGIEERFYILVTLFEKLSSRLAKRTTSPQPLLDQALFNKLREEIAAVTAAYKSNMCSSNPSAFEILMSRVGNLNKEKRSSQENMHALLGYARIPFSKEVKAFLDTERHASVHEGTVGKDEESSYWIYLKLDNMIRDILLNIVNYEGMRRRRIEYFSEAERIHMEEKR